MLPAARYGELLYSKYQYQFKNIKIILIYGIGHKFLESDLIYDEFIFIFIVH